MSTDKIQASKAKAEEAWAFRLYINGDTSKSHDAISNLEAVCEKYFKNRCNIEVIDLEKHPEIASAEQIIATPTLRITVPPLLTKMVGDLSNIEKVFVELNLPIGK